MAILGVVYRRGAGRAFWLGYALFGWGYMALASVTWWDRDANRPELVTTMLLDRLRPLLQPGGDPAATSSLLSRLLGPDPRDRVILSKLDQPVSMSFANETPLTDVLTYIKSATAGPKDTGIPIYVDPVGLQEVKITMTSPVAVDIEGAPLKTTLRLLLRPLGLSYTVKDGLLTISKGSVFPDAADAFRHIGHCYRALLAGWIGGIASRSFYATRDEAPERQESSEGAKPRV